jgi:hypothetical protein
MLTEKKEIKVYGKAYKKAFKKRYQKIHARLIAAGEDEELAHIETRDTAHDWAGDMADTALSKFRTENSHMYA